MSHQSMSVSFYKVYSNRKFYSVYCNDHDIVTMLQQNTPEIHTTGASPTIMFSHIGMRNIISMLGGTVFALVAISLLLILALGSVRYGLLTLVPNLAPAGMAFGLWGLVNRLAAIVGPLSYGLLSHLAGDLRTAMLSTLAFFLLGLLLLTRVSDARGRQAAIDAAAH